MRLQLLINVFYLAQLAGKRRLVTIVSGNVHDSANLYQLIDSCFAPVVQLILKLLELLHRLQYLVNRDAVFDKQVIRLTVAPMQWPLRPAVRRRDTLHSSKLQPLGGTHAHGIDRVRHLQAGRVSDFLQLVSGADEHHSTLRRPSPQFVELGYRRVRGIQHQPIRPYGEPHGQDGCEYHKSVTINHQF